MTPSTRNILAALQDGGWHYLADHAPVSIALAHREGLIRPNVDSGSLLDRMWRLTPDGEAEVSG